MNIVAIAELDTTLDQDRVRTVWRAVTERVPLARTRIVASPGGHVVLEAASENSCDVAVSPPGLWPDGVLEEQAAPFDHVTGPLMRLRYAPARNGGATLALVGHHAVADARTLLWLLQGVIRELAADASGLGGSQSLPIPLHAAVNPAHRWAENRSGMLQLLRELRKERDEDGTPDDVPWHERAGHGSDLSVEQLVFSESETARIIEAAQGAAATMHGVLSAAWLSALAGLLDGHPNQHRLALTTPVDLRARLVPPLRTGELGMYTTLLTTTHCPAGLAQTAHAISAEVRSRLDRGEGELFYALTRPDALALDADGLARAKEMIDTAPQAVAVSNVGVIDDKGDPEWVRSVSFVLAPTPNQVAFVAATTYRGQLVINVATDRRRLQTSTASRLVQAAAAQLRR